MCLSRDRSSQWFKRALFVGAVLVSAFLSLTGTIPGACLEKALARRFSGKTLEANLTLVREAAVKVEKNAWAALPEKDRSQAHA